MTTATMNEPTQTARDFQLERVIQDSGDPGYVNRLLIGTAVTGLVRIEWVGARYHAVKPVNWSEVDMNQQIPTFYPLRYQVADAQNLIVKNAINGGFEWLLLLEHDVVIPEDTFLLFNEWLSQKKAPIVSGLYYTRSFPAVPLVFRGRGNGTYTDWELGDTVYCDGIPTGLLLIHSSILRLMWDESPDYVCNGEVTRRVFETPRSYWKNPTTGQVNSHSGTSDLNWCTRVMSEDVMRRAGWDDYVDTLEDERYPFVCDTRIFARHIEKNGQVFP